MNYNSRFRSGGITWFYLTVKGGTDSASCDLDMAAPTGAIGGDANHDERKGQRTEKEDENKGGGSWWQPAIFAT